jgi:hypothetical protein
MARGWESKSVDDQIADAEAAAEERRNRQLPAAERELASRRDGLRLNRARVLQSLQTACDRRYRALLEQSLAHLNAEIAALEQSGPKAGGS